MNAMPERMADHWWWRPGVRPGRRLYVWHVIFDDHPVVRDLARERQERLAGLAGLDLVPIQWLHMTTQIVGFVDEIEDVEVEEMVDGATKRLRRLAPVGVSVGWPLVHPESVMLGVRPRQALDPVREGIREAVSAAIRVHQLADEPRWTPHVSIAYSTSIRPAAPIAEALGSWPKPRQVVIDQVRLVTQERVGHLYRWEEVATVRW